MRPALLSWLLATLLMLSFGASGSRAHAAPDPKWPDPQRATPDQLDRFVAAKVDELNLPGLAVVVVAEGKVLFEGTYGEASPGVPVSLDTPFRLGSTSKQFTGLAVQQLIAQGRLSLDTPVGAALPEVGQNAAWSTTTVQHLLAHRSGLSVQDGYDQWSPRPAATTVQEEAGRLATVPLTHPAGGTYEYSNANYTLLGAIIERITGLPFEDALQELVAQPLGLTSTTTDLERARTNGLASEYYTWFGQVNVPTPAPASQVAAPSAYVTSSARDLTTLLQAHLAQPTGGTEARAAARRAGGAIPQHPDDARGTRNAGGGADARDDEGWDDPQRPTFWEHHGSIARSQSHLGFAPDYGLGVVALTNTGGGVDQQRGRDFTYDLVHEVLGTQPRARARDPLIKAVPALIIGLPILQLLAVAWLSLRRAGTVPWWWAPLAFGGVLAAVSLVLAVVILPGRTGLSLVDPVWMASAPDLAVSLWLQLMLSAWILVLIGVRVVQWPRRKPPRSGPVGAELRT